jgi:hypothetical protein
MRAVNTKTRITEFSVSEVKELVKHLPLAECFSIFEIFFWEIYQQSAVDSSGLELLVNMCDSFDYLPPATYYLELVRAIQRYAISKNIDALNRAVAEFKAQIANSNFDASYSLSCVETFMSL